MWISALHETRILHVSKGFHKLGNVVSLSFSVFPALGVGTEGQRPCRPWQPSLQLRGGGSSLGYQQPLYREPQRKYVTTGPRESGPLVAERFWAISLHTAGVKAEYRMKPAPLRLWYRVKEAVLDGGTDC